MSRSCIDLLHDSALRDHALEYAKPLLSTLAVVTLGSLMFGCQPKSYAPPYTPAANPVIGTTAGVAGTKVPSAGAAATAPIGTAVAGSTGAVVAAGTTGSGATAPVAGAGASGASAGGGGTTGAIVAGAGAAGAAATGPSFTALYNKELYACQNPSCHSSDNPTVRISIDMRTRDSAYDTLVNQPVLATGQCGGKSFKKVDTANPDMSLIIAKLNVEGMPRPPCGGPMPPGGTFEPEMVAAIRAWIAAGAPNN